MTHATPHRPRCADVPFVEHELEKAPGWYDAKVGDHVWNWKMGEGHVIDRIASCATDHHYCDDPGWSLEPHQHQDVIMCECGRLWLADHHWSLMPKATVAA